MRPVFVPEIYIGLTQDFSRGSAWSVYAATTDVNGKPVYYDLAITKREPTEPGNYSLPSAIVPKAMLTPIVNALKSALADAGFLANTSSAESELKATQKHLEDFRRLVFNERKIEL